MQVNIFEAKARLSELVKSAMAGEDVIVANRGVPVVRIVAVNSQQQAGARRARSKATRGALAAWLAANPVPEYARRSAGEIDAGVRAERDSWD